LRDLLVILNPRNIRECIASYQRLTIDRLWLRCMTETQIADRWSEILDVASSYDRMMLVSDDCIVRQHAVDAVTDLLDEGHPVVTGFCNLAVDDNRANLVRSPLADQPAEDAYDLYHLAEVMAWPDPAVPTGLVNLAVTGMSVEMWRRFSFGCYGRRAGVGFASDFHLSKRLERAAIPMVGARDGFVWHVKERWNRGDTDPAKKLLVGVKPATIELVRQTEGT
jgi:hypothetical protein